MRMLFWLCATFAPYLAIAAIHEIPPPLEVTPLPPAERAERFAEADALPWRDAFTYAGAADWREHWRLDGKNVRVERVADGLELHAGPDRSDASHMVLWTQERFAGDLRIEYDFTRLDESDWGVNILYLQATRLGRGPYQQDIFAWADRRRVAAMSEYFENMLLYHVSYAAFDTTDREHKTDYLCARRYPAPQFGVRGGVGENETDVYFDANRIGPDYRDTGLFQTGRTVHMTWIKRGTQLYLRA